MAKLTSRATGALAYLGLDWLDVCDRGTLARVAAAEATEGQS